VRGHTQTRRGDAGFTLVELLVAMAAGTVVLFGLISIMIVTLHQSQRTFTRIDATRQSRTALATIENEMHSACIAGTQAPPIQTGSTDDSVGFLSFYGTAANPTPVWHQLTFDATTKSLIDRSYNAAGTGPNWTQGTLLSTTTLLANVTRQSASTPIFQYFAYTPEYTDPSGDVYYAIPDGSTPVPVTGAALAAAPLTTPLSASDADNTVEIIINLQVGASSSSLSRGSLAGTSDPVTDAISLRLTTPPNEVDAGTSAGGYGPCQ
jgi:prepilin-type N-terminal cleavage/methylation domain-containing protein